MLTSFGSTTTSIASDLAQYEVLKCSLNPSSNAYATIMSHMYMYINIRECAIALSI